MQLVPVARSANTLLFLIIIAVLLPFPAAAKTKGNLDSLFQAQIATRPAPMLATMPPEEIGAWKALFEVSDGQLLLAFDAETMTPGTLQAIQYRSNATEAAQVVNEFLSAHGKSLERLLAMGPQDVLVLNSNWQPKTGLAGAVVTYVRTHAGTPVFDNYVQFHVARAPDSAGFVLSGVTARMHRSVAQAVDPGQPYVTGAQAPSLIKSAGLGDFSLKSSAVIWLPHQATARLAVRLQGTLNGLGHDVFLDAKSGGILRSVVQHAHQNGTVNIHATAPNEAFSASAGKTSKHFPNANVYRGVMGTPLRGNSAMLVGKTDYHGQYDIPTQSSDGTICPSCWTLSALSQTSVNSWLDEGNSFNVGDLTSLLNNVLNLPPGTAFDLPWSSSNHAGRRREVQYLLEYAHHYYKDVLGAPVYRSNFVVDFDSNCVPCPGTGIPCRPDCKVGSTFECDASTATCGLQVKCGAYGDFVPFMSNDGEINTRDTVFHEYTHLMDYSVRGYWPLAPAQDFPQYDPPNNAMASAYYEGLGSFGGGLLSNFESEDGATIGDAVTYPAKYSCTNPYAGVPLTSIFNDYTLYSGGPLSFPSILWYLPTVNDSTRLVNCANVASFSQCPANSTYVNLVTKARDPWNTHAQTVYEVAKAYHRRITDANPQITCDSTNSLVIGNPTPDPFPFADDQTNVSYFAPLFPQDFPPSLTGYSLGSTPWGVSQVGPDSCTGSELSTCKPLALDYTWDMDKWSFVGKAGETYSIGTLVDHFEVDTKMDIVDEYGTSLSVCGAGTSPCSNDDCSACATGGPYCSCLTFKPVVTGVYRIFVYPYQDTGGWNSEVGANAKYSLSVTQIADDHGDTALAATPLPPDGQLRMAYLNSTTPADEDWYFVVSEGADSLGIVACSDAGNFNPLIVVYDQNFAFIQSIWGTNCGSTANIPVAKGVYYLRVYNPGGSVGAYWMSASLGVDVGNTPAAAHDMYDAAVAMPATGIRPIPGYFSWGGDADVFKFTAVKGQIFDFSAFAHSPTVAPRIRIYTPTGSFKNSAADQCNGGITNTVYTSPTFILRDDIGGVVRDASETRHNSHLSFVAPSDGVYNVQITNQLSSPGGYTFYFYNTALWWTGYAELP